MKSNLKLGIIFIFLGIILTGCSKASSVNELIDNASNQVIGSANISFKDINGVEWSESVEYDEDTLHCVSENGEYYTESGIDYVKVDETQWEKYESSRRLIKNINLSDYEFTLDKKSKSYELFGTIPASDVIDDYSDDFIAQLTFDKRTESLIRFILQSEEVRIVIDISSGSKISVPDYILMSTDKDYVQIIYGVEERSNIDNTDDYDESIDLVMSDDIFSNELPLVEIVFGKDMVELVEVADWSGFDVQSDENYALANFINYYYPQDLVSYISLWNSLDKSTKKALVSFIDNDLISIDTFVIDGADGTEVENILKEIRDNGTD